MLVKGGRSHPKRRRNMTSPRAKRTTKRRPRKVPSPLYWVWYVQTRYSKQGIEHPTPPTKPCLLYVSSFEPTPPPTTIMYVCVLQVLFLIDNSCVILVEAQCLMPWFWGPPPTPTNQFFGSFWLVSIIFVKSNTSAIKQKQTQTLRRFDVRLLY